MSSSRSKPHVAPFVGPPWYVAAAWLVVALVAQATIVHQLAIRNVVPSLVLVVVVWYAIRVDARRAALYRISRRVWRGRTLAADRRIVDDPTCLSALLAGTLSRGFFADSIPLAASVMVATTLLRALALLDRHGTSGYPSGLGTMHFHETLVQAVLNALVIVVAMIVARRFDTADVNANQRPPRVKPWRTPPGGLPASALVVASRSRAARAPGRGPAVDGERYRAAALANQVRLIPVAAPRGMIFDRHGAVIARSRPSFVVALIPSEVTDAPASLRRWRRFSASTSSRCGTACSIIAG